MKKQDVDGSSPDTIRERPDFSDVTGRWTPDPACDEILAVQRQIDWDKWK